MPAPATAPATASAYIRHDQNLQKGSVDDHGDAEYLRLEQNVPDGFVFDLQQDLKRLGFDAVGRADGAFGEKTQQAVIQFQRLAGVPAKGIVDPITKNAIRTWLIHGYTRQSPPLRHPPQAPAADNGALLITPRVPHFSQGDARWAARILGDRATIQRKGCAITSIAMILSFYGRHVTPATLDAFLDTEDGYVGDSVVWAVAGRHEQARRTKLKYGRKRASPGALRTLLSKRIRQNRPTLVRVDYNVDQDIRYDHFVVCVGETDRGDFIMNDPATRLGDGYANLNPDNLIEKTTRKNGYRMVQLDWYDQVT